MAVIHFVGGDKIQIGESVDEAIQRIAAAEPKGPTLFVKFSRPAEKAADEWVNVAQVLRVAEY